MTPCDWCAGGESWPCTCEEFCGSQDCDRGNGWIWEDDGGDDRPPHHVDVEPDRRYL